MQNPNDMESTKKATTLTAPNTPLEETLSPEAADNLESTEASEYQAVGPESEIIETTFTLEAASLLEEESNTEQTEYQAVGPEIIPSESPIITPTVLEKMPLPTAALDYNSAEPEQNDKEITELTRRIIPISQEDRIQATASNTENLNFEIKPVDLEIPITAQAPKQVPTNSNDYLLPVPNTSGNKTDSVIYDQLTPYQPSSPSTKSQTNSKNYDQMVVEQPNANDSKISTATRDYVGAIKTCPDQLANDMLFAFRAGFLVFKPVSDGARMLCLPVDYLATYLTCGRLPWIYSDEETPASVCGFRTEVHGVSGEAVGAVLQKATAAIISTPFSCIGGSIHSLFKAATGRVSEPASYANSAEKADQMCSAIQQKLGC